MKRAPTRGARDAGFHALRAFAAFERACIEREHTDAGEVWDVLCTLRCALSAVLGACEHCDAPEGEPVCLGAGGVARLCDVCRIAVTHGAACRLGLACPEEHGQQPGGAYNLPAGEP